MAQTQLNLFDDKGTVIKTRHSSFETKFSNESGPPSKSNTPSSSDIDISKTKDFPGITHTKCLKRYGSLQKDTSDSCYTNYEHDEVPVRDSNCFSNELLADDGLSSNTKELSNSDLDKLEIRIFKNISEELKTEDHSTDSHAYSIQLFKATVQEILDKFYNNVRDFEIYKKKYQDILSRNKENLVDEMEDFIKEMIQNIVSSDSCVSSGNKASKLPSTEIDTVDNFGDESKTFSVDTGNCQIVIQKTVEAYKNENYLTDSTFDDETGKTNYSDYKLYNIYLLKRKPCEIKMDGPNLLSEINIGNQHPKDVDQSASADNLKSVAAKRLQVAKYMKQAERQSSDKIIPVKISCAKKNIHSEDDPDVLDENNKSFIYKICNFLCKKLRKTSFG